MKKNNLVIIILVLMIFAVTQGFGLLSPKSVIYFRINQLGFLPEDFKTGIVFSNSELLYKKFDVINIEKNKIVYSGRIKDYLGEWGNFKYHYMIDFSSVNEKGNYFIEVDGKRSFRFQIADKIYNSLVDSILKFFAVQRCGPTNPFLHKVCHLYDSPIIIGDNSQSQVDVTGGWHDAGDYIKFLTTTAYTTYLLLFSYEFDKTKFEFDRNKNNAPDILEEAKVGIDWMIRSNYKNGKLVTQVGDMRDHEMGWRMPDEDQLKYERPAYVTLSKNQIGMFVSVMALASRIWKDRFNDINFSDKCLKTALDLYAYRDRCPDVDSNYSGMYQEKSYLGKLALGAIELYNSTLNNKFLDDAVNYGDNAKSDYWWSWGDINSLAHYKIANYFPRFLTYLENNVINFNNNKNKNIFGEAASYSWGSNNTFLGAALQTILLKRLSNDNRFDSLIIIQRDYILGRNPWGLSFIYKIGTLYPKNLHSQIAFFNKGYLPGAVTAGPISKELFDSFNNIKRTNFQYNLFNSVTALYFDDWNDYISNEPTICTNATALFVYSYFAK